MLKTGERFNALVSHREFYPARFRESEALAEPIEMPQLYAFFAIYRISTKNTIRHEESTSWNLSLWKRGS
jgi:hypothetical protein